MSLTPHTLTQLIRGNQLALRMVYDRYSKSIYQLAFHILKDEEHAEEIVQDSFIQLWKSRTGLSENSNLKALLFVICRNNSFNRLKIIRRHRSRFVQCSEQEIESKYFLDQNPMYEKDFQEVLDSIINKLPPKQRTVFRMSRIDGFSHQEIADKLQISKNTVKNHLIAALKYVKEQLQHSGRQGSVYFLIYLYLFS